MTLVPTASYLGPSEVGLIQGLQPDSVEEWRTAVALYTYRWDYRYQVPMGGGNRRKGGTVIDFLVETRPNMTALFVDGQYWHRGQQRSLDILGRINLKTLFAGRYGHEPNILELFASDLYDQEAANSAILKHIGRN